MEFHEKLKEWMQLDCVAPEDIPKIDLYMDQITTFLEEQLKNTKRHEDDKIFTKTMINNYSKIIFCRLRLKRNIPGII